MVFVLSSVGMIQSQVYSMRGVPPYDVPTSSTRFLGGLWACCSSDRRHAANWPLLILASSSASSAYARGLVRGAPIKGNPIAAGWVPLRMLGAADHRLLGDRPGADLRGLRRWTSGAVRRRRW